MAGGRAPRKHLPATGSLTFVESEPISAANASSPAKAWPSEKHFG
jgi:hypothetical protein